jgi:uncharacterized protein YbbC (DUF1343 family)
VNKKLLLCLCLLFPGVASAKSDFGIDVLRKENFKSLEGANVALFVNQTSVDKFGERTVDLFKKAPGLNLVCLFSPEHGLQGATPHGQAVENSTDSISGVPIYSVY